MTLLLALIQHAEEGAGAPNVFALSTSVSFWTIVIFLLLLGVLAKFAFPPILGYAAAREQRIQNSLDEARRLRAEAETLLAQQREQLNQARQESQQIVVEARQAAERVRHDLIEQTRAQQEQMLERARQEIERERELAVESVRREAVELALAAAARLLDQKLTAAEDRRLISDYLGRVAAGETAGVA
jgi:F-type H+-transporting ATPase subunit b